MTYDLIVIGGGPAGYLAAERAAQNGLSVLCAEKKNLGGVCLNEGCIPTKTLLYSAKLYSGAQHGEKYGVTAESLNIDHAKVIARKDKVVKTLVAGVKSALKNCGVNVIAGSAIITGKSAEGFTVRINEEIYFSHKLLIASGSSPAVPPINGLKEQLSTGFVLTSTEALSLKTAPARLIVIGGGVIGLEMACYFNSIGSEVSVIEMLDHIAGENDVEITALLKKGLEKNGMKFFLSSKVISIGENSVTFEQNGEPTVLDADNVLLSIGRRANTSDLGLETLGIELNRGAIVTDDHMRTNVPDVFAAGDVNGKSMLAHTAYREAEVAISNICGKEDVMLYNAIPGVLYTNPELASVGETEATAAAKGLDYSVVKLPMRFSGRYLAENEGGDGIMKLITLNGTKKIVGAQFLANYSSEFIATLCTFIEKGYSVDDVKKIVFPHPTVGEIIREAVFHA